MNRESSRALRDALVYLPIWFVSEALRNLPPDRSVAAGGALARRFAEWIGWRSEVALANLSIAFPEWSNAQRKEVRVESLVNLGRSVAETALLGGRYRDELLGRVRVEGLEHYEAARARTNTGEVLAISAHFGSWELLAAAMSRRGQAISVVHHPLDNRHLDRMIGAVRTGAGLETLELGRAGFGVVRALERGRMVAVLMDQDTRRSEGVFAPFFSRDACTRAAPVRLAQRRGTPLVPVFLFREGQECRHVARFYPALELEANPEESPETLLRNVERMNRCIEVAIEEAPEQWAWVHKRWKTRPDGEVGRIYPPRRGGRGAGAARDVADPDRASGPT